MATSYRVIISTVLLLTSGPVFADANDGVFLGYTVGGRITISDAQWIKTDRAFSNKGGSRGSGPLTLYLDSPPEEERVIRNYETSFYIPVKPVSDSFDEVFLMFTPMSKTVIEIRGYIRTKGRNKYFNLSDAPPGDERYWSDMFSIQQQRMFEEAKHLANDLFAVLRSKYPKWKPALDKDILATPSKCQFHKLPFNGLYVCEILGDNFGLRVQTKEDSGNTNIRIGPGSFTESRDYGEVEVIFFALNGRLFDLEREEKKQYIEWLRKQRLGEIDQEGL